MEDDSPKPKPADPALTRFYEEILRLQLTPEEKAALEKAVRTGTIADRGDKVTTYALDQKMESGVRAAAQAAREWETARQAAYDKWAREQYFAMIHVGEEGTGTEVLAVVPGAEMTPPEVNLFYYEKGFDVGTVEAFWVTPESYRNWAEKKGVLEYIGRKPGEIDPVAEAIRREIK